MQDLNHWGLWEPEEEPEEEWKFLEKNSNSEIK
jgi:hypothetical protein